MQLPERVVVYEQGDVEGMLYRVKEKLPQKTECSLLVATSDALLLCQVPRTFKTVQHLLHISVLGGLHGTCLPVTVCVCVCVLGM